MITPDEQLERIIESEDYEPQLDKELRLNREYDEYLESMED